MADTELVAGEFVLQDLFNEFTYQVNQKIDTILSESHLQVRDCTSRFFIYIHCYLYRYHKKV